MIGILFSYHRKLRHSVVHCENIWVLIQLCRFIDRLLQIC